MSMATRGPASSGTNGRDPQRDAGGRDKDLIGPGNPRTDISSCSADKASVERAPRKLGHLFPQTIQRIILFAHARFNPLPDLGA